MMFLSPWGLLGLIAVPTILLLYILKQKREKLAVSSLILWRQVLLDMQARTPWQKLRKNLLMFLQLLAALLIVLALAGMALQLGARPQESVILVVDSSLSMSSADIQPTRLDAAKKDAVRYINELSKDSLVTVVSIGREAGVLLYASSAKDEIIKSIEAIEQTYSYLDLTRTEELILSLKRQDPGAVVVLFGDKPVRVGSEEVQFSNYRKQNDNLAIIRFTHTRAGDQITGMSIIRNQGNTETEVSVSLYGDDKFLDSKRINISGNEIQTVWWRGIPSTAKTLRCVIDTEDILEADNFAYDTVSSDETVKVLLVTKGNLFLEKVISLIEGVELVRTLPEEITEYKGYDLYIMDGTIPEVLPGDGNIVIFDPHPNSMFPVGGWMDTPGVRGVEHPVFQYLDNIRFSIGRTRILEKTELFESLMEYNGNPIIMEGQVQNTRILVFGFNLYETDLPLRSEFPVIMSNILSEYAPKRGSQIPDMLVGDTFQFKLRPDTESARIVLPGGKNMAIAPPMPPETFTETNKPGIYRLEQKKTAQTIETFFAVNLPDEWLAENKPEGNITGDDGPGIHIPLKKTGVLFILPLLIAALIILSLEWWYYANRNYV